MFNPTQAVIGLFCQKQVDNYRDMYGGLKHDFEEINCWVAKMALEIISGSDALYHNAEHTMLVTLVGHEVLRGKHMRDGGVTPADWLHFSISLLCHDIGFVKGVCRQDRRDEGLYAAGSNGAMIRLPPGSSDASLAPYHVDRGKLFVEERFGGHPVIDAEVIKRNIELTRFPVPASGDHQDTINYPGLVRAADLIGQLSDPRYLKKIVGLFYEFEETGVNKVLGYRDPGDLRKNYPKFYWQAIFPYIRQSLGYLGLTQEGHQITANLYTHVFVVEHERPSEDWVRKLKDRDRYVRMHAVAALGQMGPEARSAVPALTEALADRDESIRQWAAYALGQIGPAARAALPALREALGDANTFARLKAAEALWALAPQEEPAIETFVAALGDANWLAARESAYALGKLGKRARPAAAALGAALQGKSSEVRKAAAEALRKIDAASAVAALTAALRSEDKYVRMESAFLLGELGPEAAAALSGLLEALRDRSWLVVRAAAVALGQIGPAARAAVPALIAALNDDHELVRQAAAEALGRIGPAAEAAAPALGEALKDKDTDVSKEAANALRKVSEREALAGPAAGSPRNGAGRASAE